MPKLDLTQVWGAATASLNSASAEIYNKIKQAHRERQRWLNYITNQWDTHTPTPTSHHGKLSYLFTHTASGNMFLRLLFIDSVIQQTETVWGRNEASTCQVHAGRKLKEVRGGNAKKAANDVLKRVCNKLEQTISAHILTSYNKSAGVTNNIKDGSQ